MVGDAEIVSYERNSGLWMEIVSYDRKLGGNEQKSETGMEISK